MNITINVGNAIEVSLSHLHRRHFAAVNLLRQLCRSHGGEFRRTFSADQVLVFAHGLLPQNLRYDETLLLHRRRLVKGLLSGEGLFYDIFTHGCVDGMRVAHRLYAFRSHQANGTDIGNNVINLTCVLVEFFLS